MLLSDKGLQKQATGEKEAQTETVEIADDSSQGSITVTHEGEYDGAPFVVALPWISNTSGGSSSSNVTDFRKDPDNSDETETTIIVELDTAPGSGETTTVSADVLIMGKYGGQT